MRIVVSSLLVLALLIPAVTAQQGPPDHARRNAPPQVLTRDNLARTVESLASAGLSGVLFVRLENQLVLERAFGAANPDLNIPNRPDTVFGIGSRPMDFTMAAVLLLAQQGRVDLNHSITHYFSDVPADKKAITLRHLLTGRSGLPDFFHNVLDWDADLAWVDRDEALARLLKAPLKFAPGQDEAHSHAAFGLLAALVEKVSGQPYMDFLSRHFFTPAGMKRTGEYGQTLGLELKDFAAGAGPQKVGLPNIPPNWGPTSWLVKGSGGMCSTLGDLRRFYAFLRSGKVLDAEHSRAFTGPAINLDGSDRGFELFSAWFPPDNEVYLFVNNRGDRDQFMRFIRALERLALPEREK
ncbi:MAG: serine hydrolase domain-containing protein [Acidobacteriota bacterium]|jgi:CubicO group peptidase (beta-lactamase class C family)|nr:serine hydrolase domain-containing protein [Acidobacteriota bacterium]